MSLSLLYDVGLVIIAGTVLAGLARLFKQPLILGYVVAGLLIGPYSFDLLVDEEIIKTLSELGIAFLLFIIGVEFDVKKLKTAGVSLLSIGVLQVVITFLLGFGIAKYLDFPTQAAWYLGFVVALSSTLIVIKLLSDTGELDSIHGRLILGILVIQDIFAVLALSFLGTAEAITAASIFAIIGKGFLLLIIGYLTAKYVLPPILNFVVESTELLFITALTTCFAFMGLATGFGYSLAIGAFAAGIVIGATPFSHDIVSKIKPLRDFFVVMFFVILGTSLVLTDLHTLLFPAFLFLLAVFIAKPLVLFLLSKLFGYGNRSSFFTGTGLAQVSEFSLILAAQGYAFGQISQSTFTLTTLLAIFTITITAYVMPYSEQLYRFFCRFMPAANLEEYTDKLSGRLKNHVVVFGTYRIGMHVIHTLKKQRIPFVVVDHNPERIEELSKQDIDCICSDMMNYEIVELLHLDRARMIISTIQKFESNLFLLAELHHIKSKALTIFTTRSMMDAIALYDAGADYVIVPESLGGEKISNYLTHLSDKGIKSWGKKHKKYLQQLLRKKLGNSKYGRF